MLSFPNDSGFSAQHGHTYNLDLASLEILTGPIGKFNYLLNSIRKLCDNKKEKKFH